MNKNLKYLRNHDGFQKYFKNTSWLFGEKIFRMFIGFFVGIWVARYLGPSKFGLLSYAQSFVGLFTALATLGLNGIVIRELVKDDKKRDDLLGTAFRLKFFGAIVVLIFLMIAINFTSNDFETNVLVFIVGSATVFQSFNVIDFYFQSKILSKYVVFANMISLSLSSLFKIFLILSDAPLIAFAWVILFDSLILSLGLIYFYFQNNLSIFSWRFDKIVAVELLKDGWPLFLSTFMIAIYSQLDQIMLKNMIDSKEVGIYAAAAKLNTFFYFIPSAILASITPAIISAKQKSETLFLKRLQSLYNLFVAYSYVVIVIIYLVIDFLILEMYGIEYEASATIMKIIIFSNIFSLLGAASSRWYINCGYENKIFHRNLFGVLFNVIANILLIPIYGAIGAALTTIIAQFGANLLFDLFDKNTRVVFHQKKDSLILKSYFLLISDNVSGK
jgi:O-antigen/teichoic acid export membrane protein